MLFFENTRKPVGLGGKFMVAMMNVGHSAVARWGLNAAPFCKAVWRIWRLRIATSMLPRPLRPSIFGLICPDASVRSGGC